VSTRTFKLAYILAASHSGSTLLALLLGSHPKMCTVGELKLGSLDDRESYLCSCRTPLVKCSFWQAVREGMKRRGFDFIPEDAGTDFRTGATPYVSRLLRPLHRRRSVEALRDALLALSPHWRAQYPVLQRRNAALVETVLELTGSEVIVDSSKTGLRLKFLRRNSALDVGAIRLVRDGRAVALTYMEPGQFADAVDPQLRGGGTGNSRSRVMGMERAALLWKRSSEEADAVIASMPRGRYLRVRYEDLCSDPERVFGAICDFLGVERVETFRDFRRAEQHVVGNGMRLDTRNEIVLDDRWRTALSASDLQAFDRVAGELNDKYGYK
jgi:hypothetical protein